jgi:phenylalanyl-tRNA synthetase beta chain
VKISLEWLRDFVSWDDEPAALAARLTAAGLNVEGIEEIRRTFPGVVVARVLEQERHPDADRLSLCRVDDGTGAPVQVVCGAPNVRAGLTVLFARVGAELPNDFRIRKSKIRGIESCGMICSAAELELSLDGSGIVELETDLPNGAPADDLFGFQDTVFEIEVTPNRPDWLSHVGVAREVAALYGTKMSLPPIWNAVQGGESLGVKVRVEDYADCGRYTAWGAQRVKIGPSPRWMQNRLRAIGARPVNNVVDITNYVMFELGHPLHAFDRGQLAGSAIIVRRAREKTSVVTLDGQTRAIEAGTLLVCDEKGPVALAGVMGLGNSEVTEQTTEILLESAFFNPSHVRRASRRLGLISESSYRFERGADWDMVERAALRALQLLQEHSGARIVPDWADRHDPDHRPADPLRLRVWQVNRVLGTAVTTDQVAQILQRLGLKVQPMGNAESISASAVNMMVHVPTHRRDLALEVDLIEEIARIHGLDQLTGRGGYRVPGGAVKRLRDVARERLCGWLSACGFTEIVTSSFMEAGDHDRLGLPADDPRRRTLAVVNPQHGGDTQLRTVLAPSALVVARRNLNAGATPPLRFFQINRVFRPDLPIGRPTRHADENLLPAEPEYLQLVVAGWRETGMGGVPADLLELRGAVETVSAHLRVPLTLEPGADAAWLEAGAAWKVLDGAGRTVGTAGRVAPGVLAAFDLDAPVALAEIRLDDLDLTPAPARFEPFVRFPAVKRDLSLVVPAAVAFGRIRETVREAGGPWLESTELFDIYRGKGVPEGSAAFGIRLKFRSPEGSLKGETVDAAIGTILAALRDRWAIEPRS